MNKRRAVTWLRRYGPAEVVALVGALAGYALLESATANHIAAAYGAAAFLFLTLAPAYAADDVDNNLHEVLTSAGFTGAVESTLVKRLGRPLNAQLANLGRLLWFDTITGLHDDNTCAGCTSA